MIIQNNFIQIKGQFGERGMNMVDIMIKRQKKAPGMDKKRLSIFLALAFGIAWLTALIIFLTGGLTDSPQITPGLPLAVVLLAGVYMWAPAIASLLTRIITREGWRDSMLRANLKRGWPFWLAAWVLPAVLTIVGLAVYFLVFPHLYDPDFSFIRLNIPAGAAAPWVLIAAQTLQGIIISPFINGFFTFGEELGWRGYLLPKLMPLGGRRKRCWYQGLFGVSGTGH
jgi:uncharacterized protein